MQVEMVVQKRDLMILLNEIYLSKKRGFNVKYPFYNLKLFYVDLDDYHLKNIVSEQDFYESRDANMPQSEFLRGDLPRYSDLRDCLITSGFLPFTNFQNISERLIDLVTTVKNPMGRSKPLYLSLDTNLAYLKFFSRYFPIFDEKQDKKIQANEFRFVVSETVKEEIDSNIKHKYRASNLNKMKNKFGNSKIVDELFNCSARKTRMAKSAQNEINFLISELEAEIAQSETFPDDKEERDRVIAKSLSTFEKEHNAEVLLLTADEDMAYHTKNANLLGDTLLIPHEIKEEKEVMPIQLVDMLYDMAITFGVILLSGIGVTIFGEWKGKGYNEYSNEHLKLKIQSDSRILREFERDLKITQKIDNLK